MCACVRACVYTSCVWIWTHRRPAVPDICTSSDCMYTSCSAVEVTMYDAPLRWMGQHDGGVPHPPLLQYIHREPGAGHVGEWGCSAGDECPHTHTNTSMYMQEIVHADIQERTEGDYLSLLSISLCVLSTSLPSGAQQGCTCLRAPPTPHHSGLFWGGDSWNWGRNGQHSQVVWSVETLFVVIQVALEP